MAKKKKSFGVSEETRRDRPSRMRRWEEEERCVANCTALVDPCGAQNYKSALGVQVTDSTTAIQHCHASRWRRTWWTWWGKGGKRREFHDASNGFVICRYPKPVQGGYRPVSCM